MIRLLPRRSNDVSYFTNDPALELDGLRHGGPGWWLRGNGDTRDPADVARVLVTSERSSVYGYDVVIAAPRPISILLAVDPEHAGGVIDAHRASVRASMAYLEDRALVVRERRRGVERDVSASWQGVVSFTHGLNRHGEPHLHDHVLVGARPLDQTNVLDSRALYAHAATADALYRASLRHELAERTPWQAWRSFEGVERVVGLDEGYRALWSGHHSERGEKLSWSRQETLASWGRDHERYKSLGVVTAPRENAHVLDEHRFAGAFEGRPDVARRHVIAAWANAATYGQRPKLLTDAVDELYPSLRDGKGVYERTIALRDARMIGPVHALGPRPLERGEFDAWRQRSREMVRSREGRSR
ncbi:MAG TPA: relaxase domain-containing protein [Acidimicrobiales bacterium]|nr:relaxase domain-containing protein [Acidimicrobiales bacterium]